MEVIRFEKYWKMELESTANFILSLYKSKANKRKRFTLERKIMTCLLHIRQYYNFYFNNDKKYPDRIKLTVYPIKNENENEYDFGKRYELYANRKKTIKIWNLCNSFIHVKIKSDFIPAYDRMYGIFFSSEFDDEKDKVLYYINLLVFAQILLSIIKNKEIGIKINFTDDGKINNIEYTNKW